MLLLDNPVRLEDVGIQNVAFTLDSGIQAVVNKEEVEIQATVHNYSRSKYRDGHQTA